MHIFGIYKEANIERQPIKNYPIKIIQDVPAICDHFQTWIFNFWLDIFAKEQHICKDTVLTWTYQLNTKKKLKKRNLFEFFKNLSQILDLFFGNCSKEHHIYSSHPPWFYHEKWRGECFKYSWDTLWNSKNHPWYLTREHYNPLC